MKNNSIKTSKSSALLSIYKINIALERINQMQFYRLSHLLFHTNLKDKHTDTNTFSRWKQDSNLTIIKLNTEK